MADNITLDAGSGGAKVKTDDDGTAHWQYVKVAHGADNTQTRVTATAGLPVQGDTAEDTAAETKPVQVGGRLDTVDRTLDNGDVGAVAIDASGAVKTVLKAGSAAIGKLVANSGVDIGDVDVISVVPGTAATNLGKAEDAAHSTSDVGVMSLSVRQDAAAATSDTDGDYQPLITDANGRLHVLDANSAAIKTAVELIDNAISGSEMQVDVVAALPAGANAIGKLAANSGVDIGDVDVISVTPGTAAANLGKAEDAAHSTGDVGVMPLAVRQDDAAGNVLAANADYIPLTTDANGLLRVMPGVQGTPVHVRINAGSAGDNTLVAAQGAGKKIRVLSLAINVAGAVDVNFEDGASSGTYLSGPWLLGDTGEAVGLVLDFSPVGHFTTSANTLLNLELGGAVAVTGHLVYDVVE